MGRRALTEEEIKLKELEKQERNQKVIIEVEMTKNELTKLIEQGEKVGLKDEKEILSLLGKGFGKGSIQFKTETRIII